MKVLLCLFLVSLFSALPWQSVGAQGTSEALDLPHAPYIKTPRSDAELLLEMAREGLGARQYKQVAGLCERVLQKDGVNKEARFLLGIAYHYLGEHDLAVEELKWVLLLDKDNVIAREYLEKSEKKSTTKWSPKEIRLLKTAMQYHVEGLNGLAIATLKEALGQNPQNIEAWELLGDVYKKLGNLTIAKSAYHKAEAKEKAREIMGEVKYVPKEWWERLTPKEAQLREANLRFVKIRDEAIKMAGMLSEFDTLTGVKLDIEAKKIDKSVEIVMDKIEGPAKSFTPEETINLLTKVERPASEAEVEQRKDKLLGLQSKYEEERSEMARKLEERRREFAEVQSYMNSLEEELKYTSLQEVGR